MTNTLFKTNGLSQEEVAAIKVFDNSHTAIEVKVPFEELSHMLQLEGLAQVIKTKVLIRVLPKENIISSLEEFADALHSLGVNEERITRLTSMANANEVMVALYRNRYNTKAYRQFVNQFALSTFRRKTFEQFVSREISFATSHFNISEDGELEVSANTVSLMSVSESAISREMTKHGKSVMFIKPSSLAVGRYEEAKENEGRPVNDLRSIVYLSRSNADEDSLYVALGLSLTKIQEMIIDNGLTIVHEDGYREKILYFQTTSSQSLRRDNTLLSADYELTPIELLNALGHNLLHYAKINDQDVTLDVSKITTREGLSGTNGLISPHLTSFVKSMKTNKLEGGYVELVSNKLDKRGNPFKILLVDDIDVLNVNTNATVLDGRTSNLINGRANRFIKLPGEQHPIILPLSDGGGLIDAKHAIPMKKELGHFPSFLQFRFAPFNKGVTTFVGGVKQRSGYDLILPKSCVKGSIENINFEDFSSEFAIASTNKRVFDVSSKRMVSHQTLNTMTVPLEARMEKIVEEFSAIENMLASEDMVAEYLGSRIEGEIQRDPLFESFSDASDSTLFVRNLIKRNPQFSKDASIRANVYATIKRSMLKYYTGGQSLEARQTVLVQDPLLFLDIITYNLKNPLNKITRITESDYPKALQSEESIVIDHDGSLIDGKYFVLKRNPSTHTDEAVSVVAIKHEGYQAQRNRYDFLFEGVIVLSAFGIKSYIMQGADFDGDQVTLISDYVDHVRKALPTHPLINGVLTDDGLVLGCPYQSENMYIPTFKHEGVTQNGWKLSFNKSIYTPELEEKIHEFKRAFHKTKLVENNVGIYTNMSVAILDKLSSFEIFLSQEGLSDKQRTAVEKAIKELQHYLRVVTLMVAWEIDKPKHGGAFTDHLSLYFIKNPHISLVAKDKDGKPIYNPVTKAAKWFKPSWLTSNPVRTKDMSAIQSTSVYAKEKFASIGVNDDIFDPTIASNNLLSIMDTVPVPDDEVLYKLIADTIKGVRKSYSLVMSRVFRQRDSVITQAAASKELIEGTEAFDTFRKWYIAFTLEEFNKTIASVLQDHQLLLRVELDKIVPLVPGDFIPEVVFGAIGYKTIHTQASISLKNRRSSENEPIQGTDLVKGFSFIRTVMKDYLLAVAEYTGPSRDLYFDPLLLENRKAAPYQIRLVVSEEMYKRADTKINAIKEKSMYNEQLTEEEQFYATLTPTQFVVHGFLAMVKMNSFEIKVVTSKDGLNQNAHYVEANGLRLGRLFSDQVARFSEVETLIEIVEANVRDNDAWFSKTGQALKSFSLTVRTIQ